VKPLKTDVAFATPWFEILAKTMQPDEAPYYSLRLPDYSAIVGPRHCLRRIPPRAPRGHTHDGGAAG
jgi:hypothetical protein